MIERLYAENLGRRHLGHILYVAGADASWVIDEVKHERSVVTVSQVSPSAMSKVTLPLYAEVDVYPPDNDSVSRLRAQPNPGRVVS